VIFNWQTHGTFTTVVGNLTSSYYGVNNLDFGRNLLTRLGQGWEVLAGVPFWYLGSSFQDAWWPAIFALAALTATVLAIARIGRPGLSRRLIFPYLIVAAVLVQSCFTVSALWHSHFVLALPLPALALGGTLDALADVWVWQRAQRVQRVGLAALAAIILCLLVGVDLRSDLQYHYALTQTGGLGSHSEAIYRLAAGLDNHQAEPLAFDWGIAAPVQFLTAGRVHPVEVFGYDSVQRPDVGFAERIRPLVREEGRLHLFHHPQDTVYQGRLAVYQQVLQEEGLVGRVVAVYYDRTGRLIFVVGDAARPPSAP
jgi:hypothetical protein